MIETAMLVALGFCAATLIALLAMPFVARRAARRAAAELEAVLPLSPGEIAAERDGIRAQAAVEHRRLEQKLERAGAVAADAEVSLGHRTAALATLERAREVDRAERTALDNDLTRSRKDLTAAALRHGELVGAVAELQDRLRTEEQERRALLLKHDEVKALAEEREASVSSLEARHTAIEARLRDRDEELERSEAELARLRATSSDAKRDRDFARNEHLLATTQRTMLQDDLGDLNRRLEEQKLRFQSKSEALNTLERRLMEETAERKVAQSALTELKRRFDQLEARLIQAGGAAAETLVEADLDALRASVVRLSDDALQVLAARPSASDGTAIEAAPLDSAARSPG